MRKLAIVCAAVLAIASCREKDDFPPPPEGSPRGIKIESAMPPDVPGGAEHAFLTTAAAYAWQEFIAMNWPAKNGVRDTPDNARKFGEQNGAMVWETFRSKVEIYPGNGSSQIGPHGWTRGAPDFGYDEAPEYTYAKNVPPCGAASNAPAYVNLDEISEIGFASMHAGVNGGGPIRYLAKANRDHYRYIVANKFWYGFSGTNTPASIAAANFTNAVKATPFVIPRGAPIVDFPDGTMEIKAAFRPLTPAEQTSGRFRQTRVRYYEKGSDGNACFAEAVWGLLALHIIHKTPTAPAWTWTTFEQADNLLTTVDGKTVPVEDDDGNVIHPVAAPNTPALQYDDGSPYEPKVRPLVSAKGPFCADPGARLFYQEIGVDKDGNPYENVPRGGNICVEDRMHRIPGDVIAINREAHDALTDYEKKNGLPPSPWHHYKLINVQTFPFDKASVTKLNAATFYTSNIVVETDYTLQNHSGGPETHTGQAPSDRSENFADLRQPPAEATYKNTYLLNADNTLRARYNMGGCMGCHGLTQVVAGSDFSYILFESSVAAPEFPETATTAITPRYVGRLPRGR